MITSHFIELGRAYLLAAMMPGPSVTLIIKNGILSEFFITVLLCFFGAFFSYIYQIYLIRYKEIKSLLKDFEKIKLEFDDLLSPFQNKNDKV
jgi:uncharacterized membrane protein YqaE (UPF0057 family)